MTEKKQASSNTLSCEWKTFLHNRVQVPAFLPFFLPHLTHHSLRLLFLYNAYILLCDTLVLVHWLLSSSLSCALQKSGTTFFFLHRRQTQAACETAALSNCGQVPNVDISRCLNSYSSSRKKSSTTECTTAKPVMLQLNDCCWKEQTGSDIYHTFAFYWTDERVKPTREKK